MEVLVATLLYLVLFLVLYSSTKKLLEKMSNLPPSPLFTLPLIGHLHLMKNPPHKHLHALSTKHGPVFCLQFGSRRVLIVNSASAAQDCVSKNDAVFANRPRLLVGKHLGYDYTNIAWAPYGDHWRNIRRIASTELLSPHRIQSLSHIRLDDVRALIHHLFRVTSENPGSVVDLRSMIFGLLFNVLRRMIVGEKNHGGEGTVVGCEEEAKEFQGILHDAQQASSRSVTDYVQLLKVFVKEAETFEAIHERMDKFFQILIDRIRGKGIDQQGASSDKGKSIVEVLLSMQGADPQYYTDEFIKSLAGILLQGGTETSITTMEWAMTLLLHNPVVLEKVRAEIESQVGCNRLIDDSDVAHLPYLSCVIKETLRLYPVLPLLLPHESSKETTIGGFRVPQGTMLFLNVWAIHQDPKVWKDPLMFKPERFITNEDAKEDFKHMPFGKGRRRCPGEALAMRMIGLALGSLVQCFDWQSISTETEDLADTNEVVIAKLRPLMAKCSTRPTVMNLLSQSLE